MKGLLRKDFYQAVRHCRSYVVLVALFLLVFLMDGGNFFFLFYPCVLCSMIPVNLLAYDERSKWDVYALTTPCTRKQLVSVKYLVGLTMQALVVPLCIGAIGIHMAMEQTFDLGAFGIMAMTIPGVSLIIGSISLPFIFWLGVEKGRMAYYGMIGFGSAVGVFLSSALEEPPAFSLTPVLLLLAAAGIYAGSWYASVRLYEKRDMK